MSTSIILLDQSSNANNVDIMVFEPVAAWGEMKHKVQLPLCRHCLRWNFGPVK